MTKASVALRRAAAALEREAKELRRLADMEDGVARVKKSVVIGRAKAIKIVRPKKKPVRKSAPKKPAKKASRPAARKALSR